MYTSDYILRLRSNDLIIESGRIRSMNMDKYKMENRIINNIMSHRNACVSLHCPNCDNNEEYIVYSLENVTCIECVEPFEMRNNVLYVKDVDVRLFRL